MAAFPADSGLVLPGGVGCDINCGVRFLNSFIPVADFMPQTENAGRAILRSVPSGLTPRSNHGFDKTDFLENRALWKRMLLDFFPVLGLLKKICNIQANPSVTDDESLPIGKNDEKIDQEDKKMKKMILIAVIVLWICMDLLSSVAGSFNASLVPADSLWVIYFDHTTFAKTKLFSILDKNWHGKEKSVKSEILDEFNIDLSKDVKGLTIAGMKRMGHNDNLVLIFQGNFDERLIIKKLKQKEKKYSSTNLSKLIVHCWDGDNYLFFPAKDVFVFCETSKGIEEIVALQTGKKKGLSDASPLAKLINEAPTNAFVRAAAIDISELARHAPKTMVLGNASLAFFIAMEEKDNLSVLLKLATESAEKARNLQQVITGLKALVGMKVMDKKDDTSMVVDLLAALNVNTEQNNLVMTFDYPVDKIGKLIENKREKHAIHVSADDCKHDEE